MTSIGGCAPLPLEHDLAAEPERPGVRVSGRGDGGYFRGARPPVVVGVLGGGQGRKQYEAGECECLSFDHCF